MTREELARKKGIAISANTRTAAEALITTSVRPPESETSESPNPHAEDRTVAVKTPENHPDIPAVSEPTAVPENVNIESDSHVEPVEDSSNDTVAVVSNETVVEPVIETSADKPAQKKRASKGNKKPKSGINIARNETSHEAPKTKTTTLRLTPSIMERLEDLAISQGYRHKTRYLDELIKAHRELFEAGKENLPVKFKPRFKEKCIIQTTMVISLENYDWLTTTHYLKTRISVTDYLNYILYLEMDELGDDYLEN